jgi:threonine dehydrogenase-like Zn-dependent dehydrogenase
VRQREPQRTGRGHRVLRRPEASGPFDGLQAGYARVPFAHTNLVAIPPGVTDEQAIMVSDIFPTGWFGARLAEVGKGDVVAVFGAGPVGQLAALSARMQGAGRVLIVDGNEDRLETARLQNAETIDFNAEHPVVAIREMTGGIGADRVIDAVGVDAQLPSRAPSSSGASAPGSSPAALGVARCSAARNRGPGGVSLSPCCPPSAGR